MFSPTLVSDLRQVHPRMAAVLEIMNEQGGLKTDRHVLYTMDDSTPEEGDHVEYALTVRTNDAGKPALVELSAVRPYADEPGATTLLFPLPEESAAAYSFVATGWRAL